MQTPVIAVLVPTRGLLFTKTVMALYRELSHFDYATFYTTNLPIPDCRNALVEQALDSGIPFTHLLMVDDDIILPEGSLKAMVEASEPIVVIDYPTHFIGKNEGLGTATYTIWKEGEEPKGEIEWAGLGCVLVEIEVFSKLNRPYFRRGGRMFDRDEKGKVYYYGELLDNHGGEDFEFYQDCKSNGYQIYVLPDMVAGHAKVMKHVGVISPGKYITQHDIHIADKVKRPWK